MLGDTRRDERSNSSVEAPEQGNRRDREELIQALKAAQIQGADDAHRDFSGEDLSGLDLTGSNLPGANFAGAKLAGCRFTRANLCGAIFTQTSLDGAEFLGANLDDADFNGARGERVGFAAISGRNIRFVGAELTETSFVQSDLQEGDFRGAVLSNAHLRDAHLQNADFTKAKLQHADLESADIRGVSFVDADLCEARLKSIRGFEKASWIGADIRQVDFCGAYLVRRQIQDENYLYEFRNQGSWYELLYRVWWLTSDCGRSLLRWSVMITGVILLFAGLYSWVSVDYGDYPTPLSPLYYSVVTLTTLGYGDVVPTSVPSQILATTEAILGYVFLGGFLSIFANKMSRRAD